MALRPRCRRCDLLACVQAKVADPQQVAELLATLVTHINGTAQPDMFRLLSELEISLTQMKVLFVLERTPELALTELAGRLSMSLPAMSRGIDGLVWSRQNAEDLRYPARSFDAYTIAFGIRNVTRIDRALAEAHRVLKFGGRFFCLEFSSTEWPGFKDAYDFYSHRLVPRIGEAIAGDADSYRYLIESIRRFPTMPEFERMIRAAGFERTRVEPIMGGLVAIHSGWKI